MRQRRVLQFPGGFVHRVGMTLQERYDDAMFDYARDDYAAALAKLQAILAEEPAHFEAQLATEMCH